MPSTPAITFLVCTRNRAEVVGECVRHLLTSPREDIEVIVRDNCSTDNTLELLRAIEDNRLKIDVAPEDQGTLSFFEISKLATGNVVTWVSDEDEFQSRELEFVLATFENDANCNVMLGGIVVGAPGRRVVFADETITDPVRACMTALSFSGCGGVFIRRSALAVPHSLNVRNLDDGYALWNYYPVGFLASRCVTRSLTTTSRVVVIQTRFAQTTNNWSKVASRASPSKDRTPHYYPESEVDRLSTNLVSVYLRALPALARFMLAYRLIRSFFSQSARYSDPALHDLLRENYSDETVQTYLNHIRATRLGHPIGRMLWSHQQMLTLPARFRQTLKHWRALGAS